MKLHYNLCGAVVLGLQQILLQKQQADAVLANMLQRNKSWGARDRHFIADNVYHIVRYKRLYEYCIGTEANSEKALWLLLGAKLYLQNIALTTWKEWEPLNTDTIQYRYQQAQTIFEIRESVPDWFNRLGKSGLGENWEKEISALNTPAQLAIRINTLKTNQANIQQLFQSEKIEFTTVPYAPDALIILNRQNFRTHAAYKNGLFEIQDVSSQLVAAFLETEPGMTVIDGCAGAGGKTLHLAALMKNKGQIISLDIYERKLQELERRANRANCKIIRTQLAGSHPPQLSESVDRILLDVPCSGTGVLRRKPDAKWNLAEKWLEEIIGTQQQILNKYAPLLSHHGMLVYATCSILPIENEKQIQAFLKQHPEYILMEEKRISPVESGFDGFYMAKLARR